MVCACINIYIHLFWHPHSSSKAVMRLGICSLNLINIPVVLNVSTASLAFAIVEVPAAVGHGGKVPVGGAKPGAAGRVRTFPTSRSTHVVDDNVHIDVHL